jgi:beta-glucosidase
VDTDAEPLYSFGHGLSYTSFEYGPPRIEGHVIEVDVTNTGKRHGRSVVQVYIRRLLTPVWPRTLELHAFQGVELALGERRRVEIPFGTDPLEQVGAVEIRVAQSARAALAVEPVVVRLRA